MLGLILNGVDLMELRSDKAKRTEGVAIAGGARLSLFNHQVD